jgi:hypothetical protein
MQNEATPSIYSSRWNIVRQHVAEKAAASREARGKPRKVFSMAQIVRTTYAINTASVSIEEANFRSVWEVVVHQADELPKLDSFSFEAPSPYARALFLPAKSGDTQIASTAAGGTTPRWSSDNTMVMENDEGATHLRIEVWNENITLDDYVASANIKLDGKKYHDKVTSWFEIDYFVSKGLLVSL